MITITAVNFRSNMVLILPLAILINGEVAAQPSVSNKEIASELSNIFKACRAVVAKNPQYIHEPQTTITEATIEDVVAKMKRDVKVFYKGFTKKPYPEEIESIVGTYRKQMEASFEKTLRDYVAGTIDLKWTGENEYVKKWDGKLLPARFAAQSAANFSKLTGGKVTVKLTTSNQLVVNTDNKPDAWESEVIEQNLLMTTFKKPGAPQIKDDAESYRYMLPEYYLAGCITCHGTDEGQEGYSIHPTKLDRSLFQFAGGISITIKK